MGFKKTRIKTGGAWDGDIWMPHKKPDDDDMAAAEKYGNRYIKSETIEGIMHRCQPFGKGEDRYKIMLGRIDEDAGKFYPDEGARPLLLPDHTSICNNFDQTKKNRDGDVIEVTPIVADGALVRVAYKGSDKVKDGDYKGSTVYVYEVDVFEK